MISNNVVTFTPSDPKNIVNLVGINDANLKLLEETYDISIVENGNTIQLSGDESTVASAVAVLNALDKVITDGIMISATDVISASKMAEKGTLEYF